MTLQDGTYYYQENKYNEKIYVTIKNNKYIYTKNNNNTSYSIMKTYEPNFYPIKITNQHQELDNIIGEF